MKIRHLLADVPRDKRDRPDYGRYLRRQVVQVTVGFYRALCSLVPVAWDNALAAFMDRALRFFCPHVLCRVRDHLRLIYGHDLGRAEREALADRVVRNACRGVTEFMRISQLSPDDVRRRADVYGKVHLHRALAAGRGAAIATAHYGNYEMLAFVCASYGHSVVAIARPMDDEATQQFTAATRGQHQVEVISKSNWREALRAMRRNAVVGIIADQAVLTGGVMAEFLGRPASTAIGPLILSRAAGAPILPSFITRDANNRFTIEIHAPLPLPDTGDNQADLQAGAQLINDAISAQIRCRPEEWLWSHRRWKSPRSTRSAAPKLERSLDLAAGE